MKKRYWILLIAALFLIASIACSDRSSSNAKHSYDTGYYESPAMASEMAYDEDSYDYNYNTVATSAKGASSVSNDVESVPTETNRKLIRDANLSVETKTYEDLLAKMEQQINLFGGYVESMSESGRSYRSSSSYRSAYITARIPADRLDEFLGIVDGLGNVTRKNLSTRDVTSNYVDIESRLNVLQTEKESLQKIMASAETTTDMLETQSRLYDVIEEIEAYEAQKRTYDSLISYSTVSIDVSEVVELTPQPEETKLEELSRRFVQSLGDLWEAIIDFCIDFIVALPWLLVLGAVGGLIFLIIFLPIHNRAKKRRKAQKEAEAAKANTAAK